MKVDIGTKIDMDAGISRLIPLLEAGRLVIFTGSGISIDSGLPSWDQLLHKFIDFCDFLQDNLEDDDKFRELLADARAKSTTYPTRVASVLKNQLLELDKKGSNFEDAFRNWLIKAFEGNPNENHKLIVNTNYPFILTCNYDMLLEEAAFNDKYSALSANTFTFKNAEKVAGAIYQKNPSIIHIHGTKNGIGLGDIVLTSEDYVKIKKAYPGFRLAIQSLFLHYSVLFIGYGSSDPHLEDLIEEMAYEYDWSESLKLPQYFLVIQKDKAGKVLEKYKKKLRTTIITIENYAQTPVFLKKLQEAVPRPRKEIPKK